MTDNKIEKFFDGCAKNWDCGEDRTDEIRALIAHAGESAGGLYGARILDVACGTGVVTGILHGLSGKKVVGVDVSGKMIEIAKRKYAGEGFAEFLHADFYEMNEDRKFDVIVVYNAYPHFLDEGKFAKKASALLLDGGRLLIIHSLSREKLNSHHKMHADGVSRPLLSPLKEALKLGAHFETVVAEEGDYYILAMKKRRK